jgi:plasmid stability protein
MAITLSIKNVPNNVAERLRRRAARHHRSLQGELLSILEETLTSHEPLHPKAALEQIRKLGLRTPAEAVSMIRRDRNAR